MIGLPLRRSEQGGYSLAERSIRARHEGDPTLYLRIAAQAIRRPGMIPYLLRAAWAFRARDWYRRPPFLPLPPRSYLRWRLDTAYGDPDANPPAEELHRYLVWSARMRAQMKDASP